MSLTGDLTGRAPSATTPLIGVRPAVGAPAEIQPHGFLLGIDPATSVIEVVSANLASFVGVQPADALGSTLVDVLGLGVADRLAFPDPALRGEIQPRSVRLPPLAGTGGPAFSAGVREPWNEFEVVVHRNGELWILEFEPAAANQVGLGSMYDSFRRTLDHLRTVEGIAALCHAAAEEVRALTGYDRVSVYRFDPAGLGEVVAESRRATMEPFLGLSYPAADVTREARALYLHNWLRLVADIDDQPVGLLYSPAAPLTDRLDLTMSVLRSESSADRQYLRAMGIAATMTISLVVDGRLWGLVTCHHQTPRRVSHQVRASCEMLGRVLSLQVRAAQARLEHERASRLDALVGEVVTAMSLAESLGAGATEVPAALLGMVDADGVVLQAEGARITAGRTPSAAEIDRLVSGVAAVAADAVPPWTTDELPTLLDRAGVGAIPGAELATGVLYLPFGGRDRGYALWLRAEQVRTVSWAGGLQTPAAAAMTPGAPGDRTRPEVIPADAASFAAWDEVVRGTSRPWLPAERAAAEAFASALPALLLHRAQRVLIEQELAASADRLSAAADRQHLEHQLHQHQRLESLGQLAGGVAHDFNNLLGVILNYVEFISDEVDAQARAVPGERWRGVQEDVEQVKAATRRAADLTHQLLAFARREAVQPRALNLNHVVVGLEKLLRRTIGEHVHLTTSLAEHLHLVLADPGQIEQILVNLAVNARDAMPGGGSLTIESAVADVAPSRSAATRSAGGPPGAAAGAADSVAVRARPVTEARVELPAGRYVRLRVRDTGTGIPQEIVDRVFEPFFTTKPTGDGTGLGLATVHGIVAQVGGVIEIESEIGRGTAVTIVFPATDVLPEVVEGSPATRPRGGGETVLVVEDGKELREVTRRLLERAGYDVLVAANGYEAIELAAQHRKPVDLLLTDLIMPFMAGDEVAARMLELWPDMRVLFMSGYAEPILVAAGGSPGPSHPLLNKPFSRPELLIKVLEVLDRPPADAAWPAAGS